MSAPDLKTIYRFEEQIEDGVQAILASDGLSVSVQRDADLVETPHIDIQAAVNGVHDPSRPHYGRTPLGDQKPDVFKATLKVSVSTDRLRNDASHGDFRARVRVLLHDISQFSEALFPYLEITRCIEISATPQIVEDQTRDVSLLTFDLVFGIRASAWPDTV